MDVFSQTIKSEIDHHQSGIDNMTRQNMWQEKIDSILQVIQSLKLQGHNVEPEAEELVHWLIQRGQLASDNVRTRYLDHLRIELDYLRANASKSTSDDSIAEKCYVAPAAPARSNLEFPRSSTAEGGRRSRIHRRRSDVSSGGAILGTQPAERPSTASALCSMTMLERQDYHLTLKRENEERKRAEKEAREIEACTYRPTFSRRTAMYADVDSVIRRQISQGSSDSVKVEAEYVPTPPKTQVKKKKKVTRRIIRKKNVTNKSSMAEEEPSGESLTEQNIDDEEEEKYEEPSGDCVEEIMEFMEEQIEQDLSQTHTPDVLDTMLTSITISDDQSIASATVGIHATEILKRRYSFAPNSDSFRGKIILQDSSLFEINSFYRMRDKSTRSKGVSLMVGVREEDWKEDIYAVCFDKSIYSEDMASEWLEGNIHRLMKYRNDLYT